MQKSFMNSIVEFSLLFIASPLIMCFDFPIMLKVIFGLLGFLYMTYILIKKKYSFFNLKTLPQHKTHFFRILLLFISLFIVTTAYIYFSYPEKLFAMPLQKTSIWLGILFGYSFLSVLPQEIIFRSFFFMRYQNLFKNKNLRIFINALVFSLGHVFFQNLLVLGVTFVGGLLFAYTYSKTNSLLLVSIEHAIYGCCLFTVGFGDQLGFPSP